jgi:flagellar FliL protein
MATQTATRISPVTDAPEDVPDAKGRGAKKAAAAKGGKGAKGDKKAKSGKKKKIIILVVVLVLAYAGYKMLMPAKAAKATAPKPGAVIAMTDTTLNLTDGHFLKVKIALQAVVGAPADLDTSKAADLTISEFTGQTMATLSTAAGRERLKTDLLTKVEAAYPKEVMGLYFTEFVMQ